MTCMEGRHKITILKQNAKKTNDFKMIEIEQKSEFFERLFIHNVPPFRIVMKSINTRNRCFSFWCCALPKFKLIGRIEYN